MQVAAAIDQGQKPEQRAGKARAPVAGSAKEKFGPAFPHVLVCLDGSPLSEQGLLHGFALAGCFGARVTLLRVLEHQHDTLHAKPLDALGWEIERAESGGYLEKVVEEYANLGLRVDAEVLQGVAAEQINAYARANAVDLTVLTTHGQSGASEWALSSTARKVVDSSVGSVMIIPVRELLVEEVRYQRILVPVDISARAQCVLPIAVAIAEAQNAELILVHVLPNFELVGPCLRGDEELEKRLRERNKRVANHHMSQLKAQHGSALERFRTVITTEGDARQMLVDVAKRERVDLVIASAHGQTGSCDCLYGGVAMHLMTHSPTPVLIVQDLQSEHLHRILHARADHMAPVQERGGSLEPR